MMVHVHKSFMPKGTSAAQRMGEQKEANNLFALLGTVVRLVPLLVECARLSRALRDLVLLEVLSVDAFRICLV